MPNLRGAVVGGQGPSVKTDQGPAGVWSDRAAVVAQTPPRVRRGSVSAAVVHPDRGRGPSAWAGHRAASDKVASAIATSNRSVADVAGEYGVSWPTAHRALVAAAARWLPEPEPTRVLGIDETRFRSVRWLLDGLTWRRSDPWLTSFVDCTPDRPGLLLGLAPGRTGGCVRTGWVSRRLPSVPRSRSW